MRRADLASEECKRRADLLASSCLLRESLPDSVHPANLEQVPETEGHGDSRLPHCLSKQRQKAIKGDLKEPTYAVQILARLGLGDMLAKTKNRCGDDVWVNEEGEEVSRQSRIEGSQGGIRACGKKMVHLKRIGRYEREIFFFRYCGQLTVAPFTEPF